MNPYRDAARAPAPSRPARRTIFDPELAGVYLVLWVVALVRVIVGVALHQPFAMDLTIASGAVCLLPVLARA